MFYLHPWEIDPDQPRLQAGRLSRFRHYRNLPDTERRLRQLLTDFKFDTMDASGGRGTRHRSSRRARGHAAAVLLVARQFVRADQMSIAMSASASRTASLAEAATGSPGGGQPTRSSGAEWDAFLESHPDATVEQLWAWREIFERVFEQRTVYLAARRGERIVGVLPLVLFKSRSSASRRCRCRTPTTPV